MLCATGLLGAAQSSAAPEPEPKPGPAAENIKQVYYEGRNINFEVRPAHRARNEFAFGPWKLGERVLREKPRDSNPNFYIVAPGEQYVDADAPQFNHTEIISGIPAKSGPVVWDVYFALVLDPALKVAAHSERELLLAAQGSFEPGDRCAFTELPAQAFLKAFFHVEDMAGLGRFRRADGTLPRLVIVPAGFVISAAAADPDAPPPLTTSERLSRALSSMMPGHHDQGATAKSKSSQQ